MAVLGTLIAVLLYPGLITTLGAGFLFSLVAGGRLQLPPGLGPTRSREGLAALLGVVLASVGLALLPWPLHPTGSGSFWLWAWAAFELAFLLPLLPALLTGAPATARAAMREAQLGAIARAALWAGLGAALMLHDTWEGLALLVHVLAIATAIAAYPAAIGWGPFAPEDRLSPGGTDAGLPDASMTFGRWASGVRAAALLVAALVAALPLGVVPGPLGLVLVAAGVALSAALLHRFEGRVPRLTLPAAVRFCLLWPLPLAVAATLALTVATRG